MCVLDVQNDLQLRKS